MQASNLVLGKHTLAERKAFVRKHIETCTTTRRKRYNTKTSGPALKGKLSVHSAKNRCATKHWKTKVAREQKHADS